MDLFASPEPLTIDCHTCVMQHTSTCDDCVVTFICTKEPDEAVIIQPPDLRSMKMLAEVGLVPALRHRPVGA